MLGELRIIVQKVNSASDLQSALNITVSCVRESLHTKVCSVYLYDSDVDGYMLMASEGLNEKAVRQVSLRADEGLVGLVLERSSPVQESKMQEHPRFKAFPQTNEDSFSSFLGVPLIEHRKSFGVLVVHTAEPRTFLPEEVPLFVVNIVKPSLLNAISPPPVAPWLPAST